MSDLIIIVLIISIVVISICSFGIINTLLYLLGIIIALDIINFIIDECI